MAENRINRRSFLKLTAAALTGAAAMQVSGWFYATKVEPGWVEITSLSLILPRLHPAFDNYRIVQLSDIHMETWMDRDKFADVVEQTNNLRADAVVITGDFVTDIFHNTPTDLIDTLRAIKASDGIFAVMGNHDYWTDIRTVRTVLAQSGVV